MVIYLYLMQKHVSEVHLPEMSIDHEIIKGSRNPF